MKIYKNDGENLKFIFNNILIPVVNMRILSYAQYTLSRE